MDTYFLKQNRQTAILQHTLSHHEMQMAAPLRVSA